MSEAGDSVFSLASWTTVDDELSCSLSLTDSGQETDEFELVESDGEDSHWDAASTRSMSVLPSAYTYEYAHGRRYHGYSSGKYPLPNDKLEQQREEAVHAMMLELTDGRLFYSDVGEYPQRIIDIGTGTVADTYPSASVIGTDLSPIQPTWLPVNARMFVEDCEDLDWLHGSYYDLVHLRGMASVLRNLDAVLNKAFAHLRPGGSIEFQEFGTQILCDDDTMEDNDAVRLFNDVSFQGMRALGCRPMERKDLEDALRTVGLVDIRCVVKKIPISTWARDRQLRMVGMFMKAVMLDSLDAFAAKPLEALDIPIEERKLLVKQVRYALESKKVHRSAKTTSRARPVTIKNHTEIESSNPNISMASTATANPAAASATAILSHASQPYSFRFMPFLRQTYQVGLPPDRPVCKAFQTGHCPNGTRCSERHVSDGRVSAPTGGLNSLVCKHWLRGLCKKGEGCEFLHEYNLRKMPECNFFMRNGYCSNGEECLYLHIDPLSRLPPCPHYDMGFCPLGPRCSKKHVRRKLCPFYLAGFCPEGPECKQGSHPKWSTNLEKPSEKSDEKKEEDTKMDFGKDDDSIGGRDQRDRDDGRHGRFGRGAGRWRGGRDRRFRGRGH
ncbi:hypothetical protein S40285_08961 [Stachybotrys chlorohalonatus IBT 40285]|uniref:mRNA 3'-end-processing protein n=1 Tax=Stachybotrys chlorohalonatus (strain IBT 40285) TaxID=1283841 RepID=A0A084Q7W2_STAC4|nr:hypothetical protein S40285_08961 [Stachybotrys chlorohalonata IBT 40285]